MSYMMRDRPDGQFEIVLTRAVLVGIFPEREVASHVMFLLKEEEVELVDDAPASFGQALRDAHAAESETQAALRDVVEPLRPPPDATACIGVAAQSPCGCRGAACVADRSTARNCLRTHHGRGKDRGNSTRLWPFDAAAARLVGQQLSQNSGASGRRWSSALQDVQRQIHPVFVEPRHLRAVQP